MFKIGQVVMFKKPNPQERGEQFRVVEMRGPRVLVEFICQTFKGDIKPQFSYDVEDMAPAPDLQATVAQMKAEVLAHIADGRIPADVSSFSELHDYIDANCLGGFCEDNGITDTLIGLYGGRDPDEGMPVQVLEYMNAAQDAINTWLEAGRA